MRHDSQRADNARPQLADPRPPVFRELGGMLLRHRVLIAACILIAGAAGVAYTLLSPPIYDATAVIRFEVERVDVPQLVQVLYTDNLVSTEMEVLRGRAPAEAVIDSLGLRARLVTPRGERITALLSTVQVPSVADSGTLVLLSRGDGSFTIGRQGSTTPLGTVRIGDTARVAGILIKLAPAAEGEDELRLRIDPWDVAIRRFEDALEVSRPARDADLIAIHAESSDPIRAAAIVNLMAHNLIADRQEARRGRTGAAVAFLELQHDSITRQLRAAENSLRAYQQREQVIDVSEQASAEIARLAGLQADLAGIRAERDAFASLVTQLRQETGGGSLAGEGISRRLMSYPSLLSSQSTSVLLGALAQLESERSQLLIRRTPEDSDVQVLTQRIRDIEGQLRGTAESYLQSLSNQVTALEREAGRFRTQLNTLPEKELQTARREREAKVLSDLWVLVQTRLKEAQVAGAGSDPTARIVDEALPAVEPVRPRPFVNLALSLVLGSIVGVVVAFARDNGDRSIRSRADALITSGLPVLGAFPRLHPGRKLRPRRRSRVGNIRAGAPLGNMSVVVPNTGSNKDGGRTTSSLASLLVTQSGASAGYLEAFNQLFVNLALGYREHPLKVVVFTSPLPGEGKTLSAINFALIGASRGLRMLLIDGDLRCGVINRVLGCPRKPGFAELLAETNEANEVLRQVSVGENGSLVVVSSGELPNVPGRILTIDRVHAVLEALSPKFDFVVIDTPPVNLLADATLIASAADAVLLVVRAGHTQIEDLSYATEQLDAAGAPVLGTLLNDIDLTHNAQDDGSYRYLADAGRYGVYGN